MNRWAALWLVALLFATGCGYTFAGTARNRPGGIHRVAIPTVKNNTTYSGLTYTLTNDLIQEFNRSRVFRLTGPHEAEALLKVHIISMNIEGASRAGLESSASRSLTVTASASLIRKDDEAVVWENPSVVSWRWYSSAGQQDYVEEQLNEALDKAARELAETIHNQIVEGF